MKKKNFLPKRFKKLSRLQLAMTALVAIAGIFAIFFAFAYTDPEDRMWEQINAYRLQNNLPAFVRADCTQTAAHAWSKRMADTADYRHGGHTTFLPNLCPGAAAGTGENIGVSGIGADSIFTEWTKSPGHDALLKSSLKYAGVGVVTNSDGETYATLIAMSCTTNCLRDAPEPPYPAPAHISPSNNATIQPCMNGSLITGTDLTYESTGSTNIASQVWYKDDSSASWTMSTWSSSQTSGTDARKTIPVAVNNGSGSTFTWQVVGGTPVGYTGRTASRTFKVAADTPPTKPVDFEMKSQNSSSITLGWISSTDNCKLTGYTLSRSEMAAVGADTNVGTLGAKKVIATLPPTATSFIDAGVRLTGVYAYELCSLDNFTTPQKTCEQTNVVKQP